MDWLELSVEANRESVESVTELFASIGYNRGVVCKEPLITSPDGPEYQIDQQRPVIVQTWVPSEGPEDQGAAELVARAEEGLWALRMIAPVGELRVTPVQEEDWANSWKAYYKPQRIGARFLVVPSWEQVELAPADLALRLDPGMAFGTGLHPSTQMCLQLLERHVRPGMETLDLGCGSGILAIGIARLGGRVLAMDNDPIAVEATRENVAINGVQEQVAVVEGSLGAGADFGHWMGWEGELAGRREEPEAAFDLIAANILAKVHVALAQDYRRALRTTHPGGGLLITAGIINEREPEVVAALEEAGFQLVERLESGDWVAFAHRLGVPGS